MKNILFSLLCFLFITGCKKDNLLEKEELMNGFDQETVAFISVENVSQITCNVIQVEFVIHEDRIPDNLDYTHIVVKDDFNSTIKFSKKKTSTF